MALHNPRLRRIVYDAGRVAIGGDISARLGSGELGATVKAKKL